jgi:hypothetical protein
MQFESCYNRGLSSLQRNYDLTEDTEEVEVEVTTIDDFLDEAIKKKVSIIKIDTQGSEYEVICGAIDTIQQSKPIIIFEFVSDYSSDPEQLIRNIMNKLSNYSIWKLKPWLQKAPWHVWDESYTPCIKEFDSAEVLTKGFWSDLICFPNDVYDLEH